MQWLDEANIPRSGTKASKLIWGWWKGEKSTEKTFQLGEVQPHRRECQDGLSTASPARADLSWGVFLRCKKKFPCKLQFRPLMASLVGFRRVVGLNRPSCVLWNVSNQEGFEFFTFGNVWWPFKFSKEQAFTQKQYGRQATVAIVATSVDLKDDERSTTSQNCLSLNFISKPWVLTMNPWNLDPLLALPMCCLSSHHPLAQTIVSHSLRVFLLSWTWGPNFFNRTKLEKVFDPQNSEK